MNKQTLSEITLKNRIFSHALATGNITKTCCYFGISHEISYEWKWLYETHSDKGLINSKSCAENPTLRLPKEIEEKILYLRQNYYFGSF